MVLALPPSYQGQQVRMRRERSYGVPDEAAPWEILKAGRLDPEPVFETSPFMPSGDLLPSGMTLDDEMTRGDLEGEGDFNSVTRMIESLFGRGIREDLGGGAFRRRGAWTGRRRARAVSYELAYGEPGAADRIPGAVFNSLDISGGRDGGFVEDGAILAKATQEDVELGGVTNEVQTVTVTGGPTGGAFVLRLPPEAGGVETDPIPPTATAAAVLAALEEADGYSGNFAVSGPAGGPWAVTFRGEYGGLNVGPMTATHTLTGGAAPDVTVAQTTAGADAAVEIPPVPVNAVDGRIFLDDSRAAIGTSKLRQIYEVSLGVGDRRDRARPINKERDSDSVVEAGDQEHTVGLTFAIDAVERRNFDAIRKGTPKFARIEWEGAEIAPGISYLLRFDLALLFSEAAAVADTQNVATRQWTARLAHLSGLGLEWELVNTLAA